jgi:hypothetical protein
LPVESVEYGRDERVEVERCERERISEAATEA